MTLWEQVDPEGRVRRAEYLFGKGGRATCTAIDLGQGQLLLCSPPGGRIADAIYQELDQHGQVVALLAPNAHHNLGIPAATARYPEAQLYAPDKAIPRTQKIVGKAATVRPLEDLQERLPSGVEALVPPHMKGPDTILRVQTAAGTLWTIHDILLNIQIISESALERWVLGLLGYQTGLRVNTFGCRWVLVGDKGPFSAWLSAELERLPPAVFVPGHGPVIREPELLARMPELAREIGR